MLEAVESKAFARGLLFSSTLSRARPPRSVSLSPAAIAVSVNLSVKSSMLFLLLESVCRSRLGLVNCPVLRRQQWPIKRDLRVQLYRATDVVDVLIHIIFCSGVGFAFGRRKQ